MKKEALKLADEIEEWVKAYFEWSGKSKLKEHSDMIRKLVAELDKKPLSDEQIDKLANEMLSDYFDMDSTIKFVREIEARHGIK